MKKVAVIGGGILGAGIATAFLMCSSIQVVLKEVRAEILAKGNKLIQGTY